MLKFAVIGILASIAVVLGGMAAAWRRACVKITRDLFTRVTPDLVGHVTPPFVAQRHGTALVFLFLTVLASFILLGWKAAIIAFFATYIAMELAGLIFPRPSNRYYLDQIISDLRTWVALHPRTGNAAEAERVRTRLQIIESAVRSGDIQIAD